MKNPIGKKVTQPNGHKAFFPEDICGIAFEFPPRVLKKAHEAALLVGKLDGISRLLPDIEFFLAMYMLKDATSSSNIEGSKATLVEGIEHEAQVSSTLPVDVLDTTQYIKAMRKGLDNLDKLPISNRFIRTLHKELMTGGREGHPSKPGEFRDLQNYIVGSSTNRVRFVPPPPSQMNRAMGELEKFIHRKDDILPIIKAGIIHAQFETVHPFRDGNGRTGRLLITFFMLQEKMLERPILFLSPYFMEHRQTYYDRLMDYHDSNYHKWLNFFLDGVIETAEESTSTVDKIVAIRERGLEKISGLSQKASEATLRVYPHLFALPIVNVATVMKWGNLTRPGAQNVINRFVEMGILTAREPDKRYGRSYVYKEYLSVFTDDDG